MGDIAFVTRFQDCLKNRSILDFLRVIDFATAGVASGVVVGDVVFEPMNPADDVAVHDGDMINIEKQFKVLGSDLIDQVDTKVHIVAKVTGVPFHRVRVIARI